MSIVERILEIFNSYAELSQGWNPEEEDDYQDFVDAVGSALFTAERGDRVDKGMVSAAIYAAERSSNATRIGWKAMRAAIQTALAQNIHADHGKGTDGPDDSDCPCRGTTSQKVCASSGCGFCNAAQNAQGAAVYQVMCTDPNIDEDGNSHEDDGRIWMDVPKTHYESLRKRPDVRSRVVYLHAERARVPDVPAIMAHLPDNRAATRCEMFRALALAAATQSEDAA